MLIDPKPIIDEVNKQVMDQVIKNIPAIIDASVEQMYQNSPILKAIMTGQPITVQFKPLVVELPPLTMRFTVGENG